MAKVSVIIPFYNQKKEYLEKAVTSVLEQSLDDIELICIDDGSDNFECFDYISKLKEKDNRISLYKQAHSGAGIARNYGIQKAVGENIMFLDSDDFYPSNNVIETLYNLKKEHNVRIAGGKHLVLNNGKYEEPYFNYGNLDEFFCNKKVKYSDYQFPWWYWCFLFDASLIKENNIKFPSYIRYQDPPFFVRVMDKAQVFYASGMVVYIHRNSNKLFNMTLTMAKNHFKGICDVLKYSKENNLDKLYSLLFDLFFSYDVPEILEKVDGIMKDDIEKMKDKIINI